MGLKLVLFTAGRCQPCRQVKPIIEELTREYGLGYEEVDIDRDGVLAVSYGVMGVPCLILLNGGEVVDMVYGVKPKSFYRKIIEGKLVDGRVRPSL